MFAMNGDVISSLVVMVQFPEDPFQLTAMCWVLPAECIDDFFNTHPGAELVDIVETANLEAEEICTHYLMYFPAWYVAPILNLQGQSLWQCWEKLIPLIHADDKLAECSIFINWLHAAITLMNMENTAKSTAMRDPDGDCFESKFNSSNDGSCIVSTKGEHYELRSC